VFLWCVHWLIAPQKLNLCWLLVTDSLVLASTTVQDHQNWTSVFSKGSVVNAKMIYLALLQSS